MRRQHSGGFAAVWVLAVAMLTGSRAPAGQEPLPAPVARPLSDYDDVDAALRATRSNLLNDVPVEGGRYFYEAFGDAAVPAAASYLGDPNRRVHFWTGSILLAAVHESSDLATRQQAPREIIGHLHGNQTMARWLRGFPPEAPDDQARQLLVEQIRAADNHHFVGPLIIAAGLADVDAIGFAYCQPAACHLSEVLTMPDMGDGEACFICREEVEAARKWIAEHYSRKRFAERVDGEVRDCRW